MRATGGFPTAMSVPKTTRAQLSATSAPGAAIVPSQEAFGSRIDGSFGVYRVAARTGFIHYEIAL